MHHILIIFLAFFEVYGAPTSANESEEALKVTPTHPFLVISHFTTQASLDADIDAAIRRIIVHQANIQKPFNDENQDKLRSILNKLKSLPEKTFAEATEIFRSYETDLSAFYNSLKEHVLQEKPNETCPKEVSLDVADYQDILDANDKDKLERFGEVVVPEAELLLVCNIKYVSLFLEQEKSNFDKSSSSVLRCVMNHLILDMAKEMKMFSEEMALSIIKSLKLASPEASAMVFSKKQITGEYLALPLMLAEKMLQVIPQRHFADMKLTLATPAAASKTAGTKTQSLILSLLDKSSVGVQTVLSSTVKLFIKYYESLGPKTFCQLKAKVEELFGEHSMTALAFGASNKYACIKNWTKPEVKKGNSKRY